MPLEYATTEKVSAYLPVAHGLSCRPKGQSLQQEVCQRTRFLSDAATPEEHPTTQTGVKDLDCEH
jgi:hypothetical protein